MALLSLGDDALLEVFSFVPVFDCARASAASRALRGSTTSQALARTRGSGEYALRGRGVVHALATAFGTRPWATDEDPHYGAHPMVPRLLKVTVNMPMPWNGDDEHGPVYDGRESHKWKVAAQPMWRHADGTACGPGIGSTVGYELPFRLRVESFQIAFGNCSASHFTDWLLEAFDPEQDTTTTPWRVLFDSGGRSPWAGEVGFGGHAIKMFHLDEPFEASRFRIRIVRRTGQCLHVRAFDLSWAVLPPWSLYLVNSAVTV